MAHGDRLTGQVVDDRRQVHAFGENHGDIRLQHLTQGLRRREEDPPGAGVTVVLKQLTGP